MSTKATFSFGESIGIFCTIEAACLSGGSVTLVLSLALYKWLRKNVFTRQRQGDAIDSSLFLNLMVADLLQSIGGLPNIKWMKDGFITEGGLCTAQAVLKQMGNQGVALTSLVIAAQTFAVLVLRWEEPRHASKLAIVGVWTLIGAIIGIPNAIHYHRNVKYHGISGYWCLILQEHKLELILGHYIWIWMSAFIMLILYIIMFLVMQEWVIIDKGIHWYKSYTANVPTAKETQKEKKSKAIARMLLYYPVLYLVCILPNSISRWMFFTDGEYHYRFVLSANTIYTLSGLFNVILFFATRPELTPLAGSNQSDSDALGHLPDHNNDDPPSTLESYPLNEFNPDALPHHDPRQSPSLRYDSLSTHRHNSNGLLDDEKSLIEQGCGYLPDR